MNNKHKYKINLIWTGNQGSGTENYISYARSHLIKAKGKPDLVGSSDPLFRGDAQKWNPEELLLASLSGCHMLWYLHLCADKKVMITAYEDSPQATMLIEKDGTGQFINAELNPLVTIAHRNQSQLARELHEQAHKYCFIANSVKFPVAVCPTLTL